MNMKIEKIKSWHIERDGGNKFEIDNIFSLQ